jgi:alkylation response protein AidB-like acyl-CoA dehydrogenase
MNLELSAEQKFIITNLRRFLEQEIEPLVNEYEKNHRPVTKDLVKKMIPFGFLGGCLPEEVGGCGIDYTTYFLMIEELSRTWPSLRGIVSVTNSLISHIYEYGTQQQKDTYLEPLMKGDKLAFFALTEPDVGSDAASINTKAVLDGDNWILNGTKMFITNGLDGDLGAVFAQTDKSKGAKGIACFLVEKDKANYLARPIEKMGMHSCPTAELVFEDCAIPKENLLGQVGDGLKQALRFLNSARVMVSFICTGVAQACVDASVRYSKERMQFGKPIGSFQLIQARISEMVTLTNAMRLLGIQASLLLDKKAPCSREASMAKLFASENALKVAEYALQIHGGYGYSTEFPIERYYRDIRHFTLAEGTTEIQHLLIGRDVLGISAFK